MVLIIAKVMAMRAMIIKMIMMLTMRITIWLNTECSNYSMYICGGFLDFCYHFVTFFEIYSLNVHQIYYEKNFLAAILRQGFCLSEKDCYKYWWMVVAFEWTLSSFLKLFTICSFWSLLKILMVNHNGVFLFKIFDWGRGNLCHSASSLGSFGTYVKQIWCYEIFSIHYDLIYEPFGSLLPSAVCQEACNITTR